MTIDVRCEIGALYRTNQEQSQLIMGPYFVSPNRCRSDFQRSSLVISHLSAEAILLKLAKQSID